MRPVRNSRQHLVASTNKNRWQSPRTLQEKFRPPLLSGNPHLGKRPPHTDSNANACPTPTHGDHSLVALAGKMVHQSITMSMAPESAALDCHEPEAEIAARDAPMALQARRDTRNGSRRDDKHAPAGPNTIMAATRPAASKARPPSALRRTLTTSADPRPPVPRICLQSFRAIWIFPISDIPAALSDALTSVIFSEPLLLWQSRKRRENWKCHQRG